MKINMIKTNQGLKPCFDSDIEKYAKLSKDWEGEVTLRIPRNYELLKKYFALINLGFDNSEYDNKDQYRFLKQMQAGYYVSIPTEKGIVHIPDSINFESMDEMTFSEVFDKVLTIISNDLQTAPEDITAELQGFY